jgi:uncharacterized damage-inducible protein DinB
LTKIFPNACNDRSCTIRNSLHAFLSEISQSLTRVRKERILKPETCNNHSVRPPVSISESRRLADLALAVRDSSLRRLEMVPVGFENWRLTREAMSFADIAQHLADADDWLIRMLEVKNLEPIVGRSGLIDIVDRNQYMGLLEELQRAGGRRVQLIESLTDVQLSELMFDARYGRDVSAWWVIVRGNLDHEAHHRGQVAAYLRMLGVGRTI